MRSNDLLPMLLIASILCLQLAEPSVGQEAAFDTSDGIVSERPLQGRYVKIEGGYMVPYQQRIPGTNTSIWLEPIPAPDKAKDSDSGLFAKPTPFWMARYETRHADYLPYMRLYRIFKSFEQSRIRPITFANSVDAVTAPTEIYDPSFTFEYGVDMQHPVGTMSLFCARQYTKWLSKLTTLDFRLPTEHEWEHACRAGTTTKWHSGNDSSQLKRYAWFGQNQTVPGYQQVGLRKPNDWGLYDVHGNMAEWVLQPGVIEPGQQVLKGGCWEFQAKDCTVDARLEFDDDTFRSYDPNLPQSPWWLASDESRWVGFRIIRSLKPMSPDERKFAWEVHSNGEEEAVESSLDAGRGVQGIVDPQLPAAIKLIPNR